MLCIEEKSHEKNEMEAAGGICAGSPVVCGSGTCRSAVQAYASEVSVYSDKIQRGKQESP